MTTKPRKEMDSYDFAQAVDSAGNEMEFSARVLVQISDQDIFHTVGRVYVDDDGDLVIETTAGYA